MDIITLAEVAGNLSVIGYGIGTLGLALVWASSSARPWNPPLVSLRCPARSRPSCSSALLLVEVLALIGFVAALII